LLQADADQKVAVAYREAAKCVVTACERMVEMYVEAQNDVPPHVTEDLATAKLEFNQLNRICLHHAARKLDASIRSGGANSDNESAVILFDAQHPLRGLPEREQ